MALVLAQELALGRAPDSMRPRHKLQPPKRQARLPLIAPQSFVYRPTVRSHRLTQMAATDLCLAAIATIRHHSESTQFRA